MTQRWAGPALVLVLASTAACGTTVGNTAGVRATQPGSGLSVPTAAPSTGVTDRILHPSETQALCDAGLGVTNLVARATARADELTPEEIRAGVQPLARMVHRHRPPYVAFLGVSTYRIAFDRPRAKIGRQDDAFEGAVAWVLPNPSGLNAHYQQPALTTAYAELRAAAHLP